MLINSENKLKITHNIRNYPQLFTSFYSSVRVLLKLQSFSSIKSITSTIIRDIRSISYNGKPIECFYFEDRKKKSDKAIILIPGFSREGFTDNRLFTLAYVLASEGYRIFLPKIFRTINYKIDRKFYENINIGLKILLKKLIDYKVGILVFHYSAPAVIKALGRVENLSNLRFLFFIGGCFDLYAHFRNVIMRNFKRKRIDDGIDINQRFNRLLFLNSFKKELGIKLSPSIQSVVLSFLKGNIAKGLQEYRYLSDNEKNLFLSFYNGEDSVYYNYFKPNQESLMNILANLSTSGEDFKSKVPFFLLHCINDGLISYEQSMHFYKKIVKYYRNVYLCTTSILDNELKFYKLWKNPGEWGKEIFRLSKVIMLAESFYDPMTMLEGSK
ncbi:MAG: hypothetical protein H0Z29_09305 [Candidatus Marinimicrobia bacterium]|nr:hypothetical protein [Candidatus Neomarinimicrobiota bacterium]